jgi:hypothetical protein
MGYLRQKKQRIRINIFLSTMSFILTLLTVLVLLKPGILSGAFNIFHLYCLSGLLFVYALFVRHFRHAVLFGLIFAIGYTALSSHGNIFCSEKFNGNKELELLFAPDEDWSTALKADKIAGGTLVVAHHYVVPYIMVDKEARVTLLKVDFRGAKKSEYPLIFNHLQEFVLTRDNPVIVFGEFGLPFWSKDFSRFLETSGLQIKNRLVFTQNSKFNIFSVPDFYVLGFRNMGIRDIQVTPPKVRTVVSYSLPKR